MDRGNTLRLLARSLVTLSFLGLAACVTTTSGPEPEKWAPEERAEAHVQLGMTYLRENQFDTAETEFNQAIQTNPKSDTAHHSMGLLMARKGQNDEATKFFARAVDLNPENFLAVNDYAIHVCQQGNAKKGISELKKIEGIPDNNQELGTRLGLGICNFEDENYEQANIYLRAVLQTSPNIAPALYRMGEISYREGNYLSARAFVERYFAAGAMSERALYLGGVVEIKLGDANKANQYKRELQRRYPSSSLAPKLEQALGE